MTPNTKVGLLIGLLFIIGIGMVLSHQANRGLQSERERSQGLTSLVPQKIPQPKPSVELAGLTASDHQELPFNLDEPVRPIGPRRSVEPIRPLPDPMVSRPLPDMPHPGVIPGDGVPAAIPGPSVVDLGPGRMNVPPLPAGWLLHKVAAGETLGVISSKYYQTCKKADVIYQANRDKLPNPDRLLVGMELRIPAQAGQPAPTAPAASTGGAVALTPRRVELPPGLAGPPEAGARGTMIDGPARGMTAASPTRGAPGYPLGSPLLERVDPGRAPSGAALLSPPPAGHSPGAGGAGATYRVKEGDTLSSIALTMLGSRSQWRALWQANKDVIEAPDHLVIGSVIRLPDTRVATAQ